MVIRDSDLGALGILVLIREIGAGIILLFIGGRDASALAKSDEG